MVASVARLSRRGPTAAYGPTRPRAINLAETLAMTSPSAGSRSASSTRHVATPMTSVNKFPDANMVSAETPRAASSVGLEKGKFEMPSVAAGGAHEARPPHAQPRLLLVRATILAPSRKKP